MIFLGIFIGLVICFNIDFIDNKFDIFFNGF